MNKKLLVAAVSAAVMAPVAAQAAPEVTLYGRIHQSIVLDNTDGKTATPVAITHAAVGSGTGPILPGDVNATFAGTTVANSDTSTRYAAEATQGTTNISSISSRWGIKANSNLGNGMTASAQYEFGVGTAERSQVTVGADKIDNNVSLRVGKVQLDGDFGSIAIGNIWSAYFNSVGAHMDPSYQIGSRAYLGGFRTGNTIQYTTASGGPVVVAFDYRTDENRTSANDANTVLNTSGFGIGLNADLSELLSGLSLAAGIDNTSYEDGDADATSNPDKDITGLALRYDLGSFFVSLGYNEMDNVDGFKLGDTKAPITSYVGGTAAVPTLIAADPTKAGKIEGTQLWLGTDLGESSSVMLGYGKRDYATDVGGAVSAKALSEVETSLGFYHDVGGGFAFLYEGRSRSFNGDTGVLNALGWHDNTQHNLGVRLDF